MNTRQWGNACDATWWVKPQKVWYVVANYFGKLQVWMIFAFTWLMKGCFECLEEGRGGGWCVWGMEVYREGRWATPARPWKTLSTHYTHTKSSSLHCFQKSILLTLNNALLPSNELSKEFLENLYIIIDGARQTINPRKSIYNIFWMSGGPLGPNFY